MRDGIGPLCILTSITRSLKFHNRNTNFEKVTCKIRDDNQCVTILLKNGKHNHRSLSLSLISDRQIFLIFKNDTMCVNTLNQIVTFVTVKDPNFQIIIILGKLVCDH